MNGYTFALFSMFLFQDKGYLCKSTQKWENGVFSHQDRIWDTSNEPEELHSVKSIGS